VPSHLSTIGFEVKTPEDFKALAARAAKEAEPVAAEPGGYRRWAGSGGEELWVQLDPRGDIIGMTPHFSGRSRIKVGLQERVRREGGTALDGAFYSWASPKTDALEDGDYPFVFDSPDFGTYSQLQVPGIAEAQVAAFTHQIKSYDSPEAFDGSQSRQIKLGSQSFIPSGLFPPGGASQSKPQSEAIITGYVAETAVRKNSLTGAEYYWALVDSLGGRFDVLIDPALLPVAPAAGGVLSGIFWLSGRLLSYPRRKQGWLGKLFSRA
jgi:hypothetical protein